MLLTSQQYVEQTRTKINQINVEDLAQKLEDFILIDIREPEEVALGKLKNALTIPRGVLEMQIINALENQKTHQGMQNVETQDLPILLYCRSGARSALAALSLEQMGFTQVYSLDTGITGWNQAGYAILN